VIGTPDHWHIPILIEAAKAKKHIYCEKPLTLTIAEAKRAIEAVQKHGVVMQTGSQQRSEGPFREVVDYIRNGKLGKIKEVFVALGGTHSTPCDLPGEEPKSEIDWDRWLGPAPKRAYNKRLAHAGEKPNDYPFNPGWREFQEYSGGFVTDWGAHHIDITQWALQMDGSGPVEVLPPDDEKASYGAKLIYRGSPAGDEIVVHHVKDIPDVPDAKNPARRRRGERHPVRRREGPAVRQPKREDQRPRRHPERAAERGGQEAAEHRPAPGELAGVHPVEASAGGQRRRRGG
jgi:hypothetical protein